MSAGDTKPTKDELLLTPELEARDQEATFNADELQVMQSQRQLDTKLKSVFEQLRAQTESAQLDEAAFEYKLAALIRQEQSGPNVSNDQAFQESDNVYSIFTRPRVWAYGLAACLVLAVTLPLLYQFSKSNSGDSAEEPVLSSIPIASQDELEEESWDNITAALVGTPADAFVYGEKSVDDIEWSSPGSLNDEPSFASTGPDLAPKSPGGVPDKPTAETLDKNVSAKKERDATESGPQSAGLDPAERLWQRYDTAPTKADRKQLLMQLQKLYQQAGQANDLRRVQKLLQELD